MKYVPRASTQRLTRMLQDFPAVLVYGPRGVLNPGGTRFRDEPVRHKVVDALGDLALLGGTLKGRLRLVRCGHGLLIETLKRAIAAGALVRTG